ncbi:HlyD family secretion protein [Bryobacter aggregatus]|uniref:HlyD family secretion protein n=1 Tax=Bryobacter aggregatus TaxID=360054 RepID=UPI0004E16B35|nr:efflux RND transporter periplasmic adaptor subunit [Bryobacter aggregatus]
MRKLILRLVILLAVVGAGYAAFRVYQQLPQRQETTATAKVKQGDVVVRSFARGELRAVRSATLTAPNLFGTVQVTKLATLGSMAREKDLIVEFDDAEVISRLEEKQLELDQIDEQVKKAQADLAIRDNQDQVELLRSRYAVRRAELEVKRNELISAIDAKKNLLTLEESKRRLAQLESDIKSRREQAQAELAVLGEKRNKATLELNRENQRLAQVKLIAPMSGLVAIKPNRSTVMMFGMTLPDIREGDQVQPGMQVADILDLSELEVVAKVGELDRANLTEGQDVSMHLDALPDKKFTGKIKSLSGTASSNMFSADPAKKFDVLFSIEMHQLLKALGANETQISRILAQAETNRHKAPLQTNASAAPDGNVADELTKKRKELVAKYANGKVLAELRPEERKAVNAKVDADLQKLGLIAASSGGGGHRLAGLFNVGGIMVSQKDLDNARLPVPPDEDNQLDVLLRPGLLADVEIVVDKVPNAIHVPIQSVFEKDGKQIVYVKNGNRFEPREIKPLKRSESVMIIASGVAVGETIALADPEAKPGDKKKGDQKSGGAAAALPGGKGGM